MLELLIGLELLLGLVLLLPKGLEVVDAEAFVDEEEEWIDGNAEE